MPLRPRLLFFAYFASNALRFVVVAARPGSAPSPALQLRLRQCQLLGDLLLPSLVRQFAAGARRRRGSLFQHLDRFLGAPGLQGIGRVLGLQRAFAISAGSLGSPLGKVNLEPGYDGKVQYVDPDVYLAMVQHASDVAERFGTKLIRGFSFYSPPGEAPEQYVGQVVERLIPICGILARKGQVYGIEVEANLVGRTGHLVAEIVQGVRKAGCRNAVSIFDGANIRVQGYSPDDIWEQYLAMKPTLGWIHVKDFLSSGPVPKIPGGHVDEEAINSFATVRRGCCGYPRILRDWKDSLPQYEPALRELGIEQVLLDLEPHVAGGGQFGGFSGVGGMVEALISLAVVLKRIGIAVELQDSGFVSKRVAELTAAGA